VPEERMARLEQEQRSLALELRLSASVAEEAQQKQLQRLRTLEARKGALRWCEGKAGCARRGS
ncbi:unnamed protein product, partial [Effrenium voratum]